MQKCEILCIYFTLIFKSEIEIPKSEIIPYIWSIMPYKEREISKLYYTMGEVAAMFDVNTSLIRFYEKEFDVLKPKKNKKGNRLFTPEDLENLRVIFHLIRDKGYTLNGAKDHLKNNLSETKDSQRIITSLENLKNFLLEVRDQM